MNTPDLLKLLHLVGVGLVFMSMGGLCVNAMLGNSKEELKGKGWLLIFISLKLGLLLTIGAGLGLSFEIGVGMKAGWVHAKLTLWLGLGVLGMVLLKKPRLANGLWIALPLILAAAAWLAGAKPF